MYLFRYVRNSIARRVGECCRRAARLVAPGGAHSHETDCILAARFKHSPAHSLKYVRNSITRRAGECCIRLLQVVAETAYEKIPTQMGRVNVRVNVGNL